MDIKTDMIAVRFDGLTPRIELTDDIAQWVKENIVSGYAIRSVYRSGYHIHFQDAAEAALFRLRWVS